MIKFNSYCSKKDINFGRLVSTKELISRYNSGEKLRYNYVFYVFQKIASGDLVLGWEPFKQEYNSRDAIGLDTRKGYFLNRVIAFIDAEKESYMKMCRSIPRSMAENLVDKGFFKRIDSKLYTEIYE